MSNSIRSFRDNYYFLSNFYPAPVTYQGLTYENNEAAFQAQKVLNKEIRRTFCNMTASEAKKEGRKVVLRKDWEDIKVDIMRELVYEKFSQNHDLREQLLATGDAYLEEGNTWGDKTWGTVNGKGANLLGQILMNVREELQELELSRDDLYEEER